MKPRPNRPKVQKPLWDFSHRRARTIYQTDPLFRQLHAQERAGKFETKRGKLLVNRVGETHRSDPTICVKIRIKNPLTGKPNVLTFKRLGFESSYDFVSVVQPR